jgi:hypothetical protein
MFTILGGRQIPADLFFRTWSLKLKAPARLFGVWRLASRLIGPGTPGSGGRMPLCAPFLAASGPTSSPLRNNAALSIAALFFPT